MQKGKRERKRGEYIETKKERESYR